jgi:hypothetical protein
MHQRAVSTWARHRSTRTTGLACRPPCEDKSESACAADKRLSPLHKQLDYRQNADGRQTGMSIQVRWGIDLI